MVFRTTFIVGHPGESDQDFEELRKLVEWAEFDHVGVFLYSPEEGTRSAEMPGAVAPEVAEARRGRVDGLAASRSAGSAWSFAWARSSTCSSKASATRAISCCRAVGGAKRPEVDGSVYLANGTARAGEIRRVLVTDAADYDLMADFIDGPGGRDAPPDAKDPRPPKVKLRTLS